MKSKQLTTFQKILFTSTVLGLLLIFGTFFYLGNKVSQERSEKFKIQQEQSRIHQNEKAAKDKQMAEVVKKYEYLEKRKLTNKRNISAFLNEIHNLGFNDNGSKSSGAGTVGLVVGYTEYEYIKKDGEFDVSVFITAYDDNTSSIFVAANY